MNRVSASGVQRYSSRTGSLHHFLPDLLAGARGYDRIAGYFRSSILDIAGEAIHSMAEGATVRIVCNSDLQPEDVLTARAAQSAMLQEWKYHLPTTITSDFQKRLQTLHDLLVSGRLQVKVLPQQSFGLLHGKAGVITKSDGERISFVGSANETLAAWRSNYEIVWSDESAESADWVQSEFDFLWHHKDAYPLAESVIQDIGRVAHRELETDLAHWRTVAPVQAAPQAIIETPIYSRENGLWAHQKWFIDHAFQRHRAGGARLILADQVGLGKTLQLALAAKLMLLSGSGNVLVVVPRPLMEQWQNELWDMLALPSAIWTGKEWIDELGITHPTSRRGHEGLRECPRRLGIVSGGLVKHSQHVRDILAGENWECVILDEAHHARRKNTGPSKRSKPAEPNNMLLFLRQIAPKSLSMLLATATPIQLDVIEAYDLLDALNIGNNKVFGADASYPEWKRSHLQGLEIISGSDDRPLRPADVWQWMRAPFPETLDVPPGWSPNERQSLEILRSALGPPRRDDDYDPEAIRSLSGRAKSRFDDVARRYFDDLNPYISHIVRRRREFLEEARDPATGEPYLPRVAVELLGDGKHEAIHAPAELRDAFAFAQAFCTEVSKREGMKSGFLQTLLLRRVGSSLAAGRSTAAKMLGAQNNDELLEGDEGTELNSMSDEDEEHQSALHPLTAAERKLLEDFQTQLNRVDGDPKYERVLELLRDGSGRYDVPTDPWKSMGCIIFSQYYDSVHALAMRLQQEFTEELIGIYAGAGRSGIWEEGRFQTVARDEIKRLVREGAIKLLIGTDAASEGLNLQRLGTLINLDLPWNPTRLEQRKGRIQRIGQPRDRVYVFNMRYADSVEDKVHQALSSRLQSINSIFGQLPDTLEDVWVLAARNQLDEARQRIEEMSIPNPFNDKYDRIADIDWESCSRVLEAHIQIDALRQPWKARRK